MRIVVLAETTPGLSPTIMAEDAVKRLEGRGHEVVFGDVGNPGKPDLSPSGLPNLIGGHVLSFSEFKVPAVAALARYQPAKSVVSIYVGNYEDKDPRDNLYYLSQFVHRPKFWNVPHSEWTFRKMVEDSKKWWSPSVVSSMLSQTRKIPFGIEEGFKKGANDPAKMIAPFNFPKAQKNISLHSEILRAYQTKTGERCTLWHAPKFSPTEKSTWDLSVYDAHEQYSDRDEFKKKVREFGVFLCTSSFESFGIYYLELLASGLVGVFYNRPWVRLLLPDYPFIVEKDELLGALLWVRENPEEARKMIRKSVREAVKKYSVDTFYDHVIDLMENSA